MKRLPKTVVALGAVSLLTDLSSEMIYPLLPAFLVMLGAGGALIGLIDGVAETTSSFLKLGSGWWADRLRRKKPLVVVGYGLATVARPLVALAQLPWHVLAIRFTDRIGKGIRSSPRDAIIAAATPADRRGAAYGFHRAMDHAGALIGPLLAYALLHGFGWAHREVFWLAAVPGVLALLVLLFAVSEGGVGRIPPAAATVAPVAPPSDPATDPLVPAPAPRLPRRLYLYLAAVGLFTLGNSTDFFLLLRAQDLGVAAAAAPLLWALLHAVKSILSTPLSALSDRLGRKRVILAGWGLYALTYLGFALADTRWHAWGLFAVYGVYFALVEGTEKAVVADLAPAELRGRAFGAFHFVIGICALPASVAFGLVWEHVGHGSAFVIGASLAGAAALVLLPQSLARTEP